MHTKNFNMLFSRFRRSGNPAVPLAGRMMIRPAVPGRLAATITMMVAGILAGGRPLYGATCFVPTGGTMNYGSIQAAVNDSRCTTIRVAPGTYKEENIQISRDVNIVGAGADKTIIEG